jgi:hypothetical protein
VRFAVAVILLALLASVFTLPSMLLEPAVSTARRISMLPPVSFLGLARTVWGKGDDPFVATMTHAAMFAFVLTALVAVTTYALSFRRSFLRIPETADAGPFPRLRVSFAPLAPLRRVFQREPAQNACYLFIVRTLLRSNAHLQVVSAFTALGLVAAVESLMSIRTDRFFLMRPTPSVDFLSIPFVLSYCLIAGVRCTFEIPSDLGANWVFKLWLSPGDRQARSVARQVLLTLSLSALVPVCFAVSLVLFGWVVALLHSAILIAGSILLVEVLLVHFRKIPFTCSYPPFESHSGVLLLAYLFGFFVYADYLPEMERWSLLSPLRTFYFVPLFAIAFVMLRAYRNQILDMDKQLIFEESSPSAF